MWAQPTCVCQHPLARPGGCGPHVPPLTYIFSPHCHLPSEKNLHCPLSHALALKPADFDLFARSSVSETISGDCCLVCDSSVCPISCIYIE